MRTITEMQQEIKNISSSLEELSKDIMEFEKKDGEKPSEDVFEKIKVYGRRNPILEHPLATKDDLIKKHYMTLLISAIYTTHKNTFDAWLLAQRIACGINLSTELSDIGLDASSLTDKQIDEFAYSIIENNLEEIFNFDLLLLYAVCGCQDIKMLEYIADLISLVNCSKEKLSELSTLAKIVAKQSSNEYLNFCVGNDKIDFQQFFCYVKQFHEGLFVYNQKSLYIWHNEQKAVSTAIIEKLPKKITSECVHIEKAIVKDTDKHIVFNGNQKIQIKNCRFWNMDNSLEIYGAAEVTIENSEFNGMNNRALFINEVDRISVSSTKFLSCKFLTGYEKRPAWGGALYIDTANHIIINHSIFHDCCAMHKYDYGNVSGAALYLKSISNGNISYCEFKNCKSQHYQYEKWYDKGYLIECDDTYHIEAKECKYDRAAYGIWSKSESGFTKI